MRFPRKISVDAHQAGKCYKTIPSFIKSLDSKVKHIVYKWKEFNCYPSKTFFFPFFKKNFFIPKRIGFKGPNLNPREILLKDLKGAVRMNKCTVVSELELFCTDERPEIPPTCCVGLVEFTAAQKTFIRCWKHSYFYNSQVCKTGLIS